MPRKQRVQGWVHEADMAEVPDGGGFRLTQQRQQVFGYGWWRIVDNEHRAVSLARLPDSR
jgi:hypothetical protein